MKNFYINLNQIKSNPDGQPTVKRQSRLMSHRGYLKNLAMIFAVLAMCMANIGMAWGASVAEGTHNFVNQSIASQYKFYKIANGIYQYRLDNYAKGTFGIQLPSGTSDGTGFVFHLESTQKVYIGICKKNGKNEIVNNLYIKSITQANFEAIEAGTNNNTTVTLSLAGSATLSQNYTFAAVGTAKTEGATVYMGELPAGYYYAYGNSTSGNGYLYSISFGTQTLFLVPNDKTGNNAKFAIYYFPGPSGYECQGWSDYMTVSPCNSSTYRADIPKGYTKVIFVRLDPSKGRNWDGKWNQTGNLTFDGTKDLFTWASGQWDGVTKTWSASTKYTISFAANGGSGSMSNVSSIACGRSVTLAANAYEKSGYVFAGWKTNVAVTANGEAVAANGIVADEATISNITSNITLTAQWNEDVACSATQPGTISKGTLSGCTMRLTASGSPASNNTWYWQASSTGTSTSESGATKDVTTPGTYYIRSYYSTGTCWSEAQSVTVSASDLTPAAPTALAKSSVTAKGVTLTVTDAANTNDYEFYVNTSSSAPGGSTPATHSSNTKSITITNLYAGTTFYAWARAKCGSNKSTWTALGDGGTFTTSTVNADYHLTNVTKSSGATTGIGGSTFTAEFAAASGYSLPSPVVTIGGNAATSGTHYTWNAGTGTLTINADKINGDIDITMSSPAAAPSSVAITGNWLYFAGETIELTATPTGGNGPVTYQWYKGGKENGNAIEGETTATYTKATCAFDDAGSYYCKVTCGGSQSTWGQNGDAYDVKIPRLYVKTGHNYDPAKTDEGNVDFTRATASTATASFSLGANWDYCFNIADGCGHYYGNAGTMQYNNYGPWVTNVNNQDCGLRTTNGATYVFTIDYSNWTELKTTVTFPSSNQAAGKVIYFDNNVLKWPGSSIYYRIGHSSHSQADLLSLVPGTANLYKMTTREYNNFSAWQIGNAEGDNGSGKSIYNTKNSPAITASTAYEGGAVTADAVTVTPGEDHSTGGSSENNNCEFYNYTITDGMKTDRVTITEPSNGTISVAYTDVEGASQSFTSGNRDLAHTVIITPTATPATGYNLGSLTVNEEAHTSGNTYTVTANTTIAATFTAKTYNITLDRNGASSGSESVTMTYNSSSHTAITAPVKAGYTFDGWYDSETNDNGSGNLVMNASGVLQENVTGFTGADGIWIKDATCTLYAKWTEDECTPTTLFSMVVADSGSDADVARQGGTLSLTTSNHLSTLTGGTATLKNNYASSGSAHKMVGKDNDERHLRFKQNDHLLIVTLDEALAEGDIISFTGYGSNQLSFTTTETRATTPATSSKSYTIPSASGLIDATTIYIWRSSGSDTYIKSLTITRPCDESAETCKTPNITNIASTTAMTTAETKSLNVTLGNADALTGTVTYAWTNSDGTAIAAAAKATGTTTARLTLTEPAAGTYTFKCTVTNDCGGDGSQSATSAVFTVVVTESTGCTEIAKVIVSGKDSGTGSGTKIAETGGCGVKLESTTASHGGNTGYKIGSSNYVYLQLASGEQFQNGDKVKVYITHLSDQGDHKLHIFQGTTSVGTEVATVASPTLGWNETTLSGVTSGNRSLTIHRSSSTKEQNHYIYAFAVERCVDCTPATHEGLAYTKTSYTVDETAEALTVTNPENVDTYQWKWNATNDRTSGTNCGTNAASFTPPTTSDVAGTRYYWCELTNDCGTVKTSAVGITVSADLSDVTVTWTDPATVNYGGGGYTITAQVTPAAWDGTLTASMLTAPEGIRIYDVVINNTEHTLQATFDVQTTFDREANATDIPFALTLAATANYDGKIDEHNVAYSACAAGGGGGILFSQNFNSATEVAYTANTAHEITTSSSNNIVGNTAASQFTYIKNNQKSNSGIAINSETGANSKDATGFFQAYYPTTGGKYALVKNTDFAATAPGAISVAMDIWFKQGSSGSEYSVTFAVGDGFSNSYDKPNSDKVHSGFSIYNNSTATLTAYASSKTNISTAAISQGSWITITWVINNSGEDLEYTNPAGTKSTLENDKFDVWVGTNQFVSGQAATTAAKALQNLYIGDPNGKNHEFRLDNLKVTDISTNSGTGSLPTALTWSNSQASGATLPKDEGTADFAITAVRDAAATTSLGAVTYSSSDASVATINETTGQVHIADNIDFGGATYKTTTITATLAASGCYKRAEITYVLRVNKRACEDVAGTVTSTSDGCTTTLTLSGYTDGATIQWYKDGVSLGSAAGAQTATYAATASGEYYAVTSKNCDRTSNTVTVTSTAVSATKIVDEWYVKNGRRTPDIALVQTKNATDFTVTSGGSPITSIGGCEFDLGTDGIIYLKGAKNDGTAPSDMTLGDDVLSITASGCTDAAPVSVTIHRQVETDKYVLAYVVTGKQDGGWTQDLPSNQTTGVELYRTLTNHFDLQATNIYATTDEQKIKEYYSRYDIIFITDYPNTKKTNETTKKSYVNALGAMIDIRPILTMEAWVSGLSNWSAKGVAGNPKSPTTRQYNMLLQCKDHEIFSGTTVETIGEGDDVKYKINMVDSTKALYDTLDTKYGAGAHAEKTGYCYGSHPALQGFVYNEAMSGMLPIGLIDDGAGNDLQVGLERQKEMEARMMVLGINADAMERLSDDGETVIVNALKYLMKKNAEDIEDCSNYFLGGASGDESNWHNVANWSGATLPDKTQEVRILAPCEIKDGQKAHVARVKIVPNGNYKSVPVTGGSLTINAGGALVVEGKVQAATAPNYYETRPTSAGNLTIQASADAQGALIFDNSEGETQATVQMWNPSYWEVEGGKKKKYWSYVAVPIQEADIPNFFWHGFTYLYDETSGWIKKGDGTSLYPFQGIGASLQTGHMETFYGPLATTESQDITLTCTAGKGQGMNLIGNSWTAPIQIANFDVADFGGATAEVWVFNTGHENKGHSTMEDGSSGTTTDGQWQTIPIGVAGLPGYTGLKVIPAMQAFEVNTISETTLHLDYDRLVRAGRENLNEPMRAPRRSAAKQIEATMRVRVSGESTHTDVYLLKDARFSDGFDNGWDGHFLSGDNRSARLYAISEEEGALAFMAQPEIEGTQLGFAPSKEGNEYTFSFSYDGDDEYYLNDLKLTTATLISAENSYLFTYEEGDTNRFYISRQPLGAPAVATGVDNPREEAKPRKFIYKDKMYILYNGRVFDATGKVVK